MNWFYALHGQQTGPVTQDELTALLRAGTISAATLVWREGLPSWTPLSSALPDLTRPLLADPAAAPLSAGSIAPAFQTAAPDNWISEEELLAADYPVEIGACINRGWETFFKNPWTLLGGSLLAWLIMMAASVMPCVGSLIAMSVIGPLMGGAYVMYLRQIRTGSTDVGLIFAAFGPRYWQHMLVYLVPTIINGLLILPLVAGMIFTMFGGVAVFGAGGQGKPDFEAIMAAIGAGALILWGIAFFIIWATAMVLTLLWFFATPLVADKGYDFWPAMQLSRKMVMKRFWAVLLLFIAVWAVSMLGMLACGVGMLISFPVAFAAITHWYEAVFCRLRPKIASK